METERDKYIAQLEGKIRKAGKAKRFVEHEDGALITTYLTEQINSIVKNIGGKKYISDHAGYVFETGQLFMAQKLLTMLNSESSTNIQDLADKLDQAKTDAV